MTPEGVGSREEGIQAGGLGLAEGVVLWAQETHLPAVGTEDCVPASSPSVALEVLGPSVTLFL